MIAKDGERMMLYEEFELEGEVERYLNNLTEAMRMTLRDMMGKGYNAAANWEVDKPRHLWLFDFPAQVVVTNTQAFWTEEAEIALMTWLADKRTPLKSTYRSATIVSKS